MERELKEKKVVTFGCSWTAGDELDRDETGEYVYDASVRDTWSYGNELKGLLNYNSFQNNGISGASNERIVRCFLNWLSKHKNDDSDFLLVFGLTEYGRRDIWLDVPSKSGFYRMYVINDDGSSGWIRDINEKTGLPISTIKSINETYFTYLYSDYMESYSYFNNVLTIQNLCKLHNIDYVFFSAFTNIPKSNFDENQIGDEEESNVESILPNLKSLIDKKHFFNIDEKYDNMFSVIENVKVATWWDEEPHDESDKKNTHFKFSLNKKRNKNLWSEGHHPNRNGHTRIAKELFDFIKSNKLI